MATSDSIELSAAVETTPGTSPSNGWFVVNNAGSDRFSLEPKTKKSGVVRADRNQGDMRKVGMDIRGGFDAEVSPSLWDKFFEAALMNNWVQNKLVIGSLDKTFSFQKKFTDISGPNNIHYKGMKCNEFKVGVPAEDFITCAFDFMGTDSSPGIVAQSLGGTPTPVPDVEAFTTGADYIDLGELLIDGNPTDVCISALEFAINNQLSGPPCIGRDSPSNFGARTAQLTGKADIHLTPNSVSLYNKAVEAREPLSIVFPFINPAGHGYTINLPRVFAPGTTIGGDGDLVITMNFEASYDSNDGHMIMIERHAPSAPTSP